MANACDRSISAETSRLTRRPCPIKPEGFQGFEGESLGVSDFANARDRSISAYTSKPSTHSQKRVEQDLGVGDFTDSLTAFRVSGFGFRVSGFGFRFRVSGFGFRVSDFGCMDWGGEPGCG